MSEPCNNKWLQSQEVYCESPKGHIGMHESEYESDLGEAGTMYWGPEVSQPEKEEQ
jgi:hypothetical protein